MEKNTNFSDCIKVIACALLIAGFTYAMYLANPTEMLSDNFIANSFHQKLKK